MRITTSFKTTYSLSRSLVAIANMDGVSIGTVVRRALATLFKERYPGIVAEDCLRMLEDTYYVTAYTAEEVSRAFSIRLPECAYKAIALISAKEGRPKASIIREAIKLYLDKRGIGNTVAYDIGKGVVVYLCSSCGAIVGYQVQPSLSIVKLPSGKCPKCNRELRAKPVNIAFIPLKEILGSTTK